MQMNEVLYSGNTAKCSIKKQKTTTHNQVIGVHKLMEWITIEQNHTWRRKHSNNHHNIQLLPGDLRTTNRTMTSSDCNEGQQKAYQYWEEKFHQSLPLHRGSPLGQPLQLPGAWCSWKPLESICFLWDHTWQENKHQSSAKHQRLHKRGRKTHLILSKEKSPSDLNIYLLWSWSAPAKRPTFPCAPLLKLSTFPQCWDKRHHPGHPRHRGSPQELLLQHWSCRCWWGPRHCSTDWSWDHI